MKSKLTPEKVALSRRAGKALEWLGPYWLRSKGFDQAVQTQKEFVAAVENAASFVDLPKNIRNDILLAERHLAPPK